MTNSNKEEIKLLPTEVKEPSFPAFVEAERMFSKFAEITKETTSRAYKYFSERGAEFGHHLEDWLRAESETLRTAPAKITDVDGIMTVMIAVPGFKPEEIEVSIKDDLLMAYGQTTAENDQRDDGVVYSEWQTNRFMRKLELPYSVDTDSIKAILDNGVLTLTMKKKEEIEAVKVAVKTA